MEIRRLTDREVKNAAPGEKDYRLSDGAGLYLVVTTSGGKLWRWSYEFNGKEKLLSYGPYPEVSISQARALKRQGIDPAAEKQARKRAEEKRELASSMPTFAALTKEWLGTWSKKKSTRYVGTVETRLDHDILPVVGDIPIDQLKATLLTGIVSKIQDDRDAEDLAWRGARAPEDETNPVLRCRKGIYRKQPDQRYSAGRFSQVAQGKEFCPDRRRGSTQVAQSTENLISLDFNTISSTLCEERTGK